MKRISVLLISVLVACGGKSNGPPLAPLPPDQPSDTGSAATETPDEKPAEPAPPKPPAGPLEAKLEPPTPTVKLLNRGRGKRVALRVASTKGAKEPVELTFDYGMVQSIGSESQTDIVPTVVLGGTAETVDVAADGTIGYAITIDSADARETEGARVPMDKFRQVVTSAVGLKLSGTVGPTGKSGTVTLHVDKQAIATPQVLDLMRYTFPAWPAFPTEPIGVGAKWRATSQLKLADRLEITAVTDYTVVSHKNKLWTIKGATKVTGADQVMQGGKISKIAGTGTSEITLADGALFPTHEARLETTFTASEAEPKEGEKPATLDFKIIVGGTLAPKPAAAPKS